MKKDSCWKVIRDGWFQYYCCKYCGYKLGLTEQYLLIKAQLPQICPSCKNKGVKK